MSHHNYNNHGRSSRPSHTGGDSHSGSFSGLEQVSGNYSSPYPTQQRATPVSYDQQYYPSAQQQTQAGYAQAHAGYSPYQQVPDARYSGAQVYGSYNRASPSSSSADPRRHPLPPLSVPRDDRWHSAQYQSTHADLQMPPTTNDMRSPHAAYSHANSGYPQYQSLASAYPSSSSRGPIPAAATANPHYHQAMPIGHSSVERTMPSSRSTTQLPYSRNATAMSPVDYEPHPDPAEPTIKKKRKRADARQLEVLNATYARTAFPSTEERAALAKELDMSARSVQIWFQNKRQAMRQGGRATTSGTNPTSMPGPAPVSTPTPPVGYRGVSPALMSPVVQQPRTAYPSRPPQPPMVRTGQTPSPPSGRSRADIDPRYGRGY